MSEVYLALARGPAGFNKLVVVKRLLSSLVADGHFLEMFLDEARLAARLNHPNIVQTNEVGVADGSYFIAMEYLDGQPLQKIVQRLLPRPLPVDVALGIAANVSAGLHYAQTLADFNGTALGIVHRDVSPQNIFVTYTGQVKIVDFGIAKAAGQTTETVTGVLKGKIAYMSPEQMGGGPIDGRADIFSLGVVLYEALTGQRLWGSPIRDVNIVKRLVSGDVPSSPRSVVPDLPEDVDHICRRALAIDRDHRYASALEMHKDLEASIARLPHRTSERGVGEMMAGMFEHERQAMAKVIERQLALIEATEESALRSVSTLSIPSAVMSFTPAKDGSAEKPEKPIWSWRGLTMRRGRMALALTTVFGVIVAIWAFSETGPDRPKASGEPPSVPAALPSASETIPALAVSDAPKASDAPKGDATADAAPRRNPSAPALALPVRRAPAYAPSRPSTSETSGPPAPPAPPIIAPTYGPLDDRH
jgi:serine/threonine-protein kinase